MNELEDANLKNPTFLAPVDPKIEAYMQSLVVDTDNPVLINMEAHAREHNFPIVDRLVGIFLQTMSLSIQATRVFEFGSGYGYSAYWFAQALGESGEVICSDGSEENLEKAKNYLSEAGVWQKIQFHIGMAQQVFSETEGLFDICYNDVDKGDYPQIWKLAKDRIRPGGFYIADNVLWRGRVALDEFTDIVPGWTEAIKEHNELIFNDPDFDAFINPIRDGVIVARRK